MIKPGTLRQEGGFTLIELVMIIVVVSVLLPMVLMPFITSTKSIKQGPGISRLVYVARANLAGEMDAVDTTWPTATNNGQYTKAQVSETVDGVTYTTDISGQFVDSNFQNTNGQAGNDKFLWITVTTTDSTGQSITLNSLKSKDYQN